MNINGIPKLCCSNGYLFINSILNTSHFVFHVYRYFSFLKVKKKYETGAMFLCITHFCLVLTLLFSNFSQFKGHSVGKKSKGHSFFMTIVLVF